MNKINLNDFVLAIKPTVSTTTTSSTTTSAVTTSKPAYSPSYSSGRAVGASYSPPASTQYNKGTDADEVVSKANGLKDFYDAYGDSDPRYGHWGMD